MQTAWEYSPELEAKRLLHNAHQIATGFFKLNGFIVLPHPAPAADNIVSLPILPYLSIPRFWDRAARLDVSTLPINVPPDLLASTLKFLPSYQPDFSATQKLWAKHQDKIISAIYDLIPGKRNSISKIIIWPTAFGTGCSFNQSKHPPEPVYIWLRQDHGVASIVEAILSSITRPDVYDHLGGLWQESEIIVDWLLTYSPLAKLIPAPTQTIKSTRTKQNAALVQKSEEFLRQIGAPHVSVDSIRSLPTANFTPREKDVLDLLLAHAPRPVTMDQIGDILFAQNPEAYSLFAISKTIQRLRDKLERSGISGSFIQTKRGEGYLLVN